MELESVARGYITLLKGTVMSELALWIQLKGGLNGEGPRATSSDDSGDRSISVPERSRIPTLYLYKAAWFILGRQPSLPHSSPSGGRLSTHFHYSRPLLHIITMFALSFLALLAFTTSARAYFLVGRQYSECPLLPLSLRLLIRTTITKQRTSSLLNVLILL